MPARIITFASLNTRLVLLGSGRFVTVLPHSLLRFADFANHLHLLAVPLPSWDVPTMIVTMRGRTLVPAAELVLDTVRKLSGPLRIGTLRGHDPLRLDPHRSRRERT